MNGLSSNRTKGFTLIELLVVIGIVVVLSVVVLLTLNPAQLLRQARDSTRISDLGTLKSALALYLADVSSPWLGTSTFCYAHASSGVTALGCGHFSTGATSTSASTTVDGTGWIPVNFSAISSGAPISVLPTDPVNDTTYYYAYKATSSTLVYELDAKMESSKYQPLEATDGGNNASRYEIGTAPGLSL